MEEDWKLGMIGKSLVSFPFFFFYVEIKILKVIIEKVEN